MTYTKVTFKPEGATRNRSVILRNANITAVITTGDQVDREGDFMGRSHIIDNALVVDYDILVMDLTHGILVEDSLDTDTL